jgi:LysM repeat protein
VYSIARKFNVDPYAIINLNNLAYPYSLSVGQSLKIPGGGSTPAPITSTPGGPTVTPGGPTPTGRTYVVQEGEWVYSIARKFGVDPQAIIDANNLQPPYVLHPGDTLIIP